MLSPNDIIYIEQQMAKAEKLLDNYEFGSYPHKKLWRTIHFYKYYYKNKLVTCTACNGSGCYDSTNSPKCGRCNGTGKERER